MEYRVDKAWSDTSDNVSVLTSTVISNKSPYLWTVSYFELEEIKKEYKVRSSSPFGKGKNEE